MYSDKRKKLTSNTRKRKSPNSINSLSDQQPSSSTSNIVELFINASDDDVVFKWTGNKLKSLLLDYIRCTALKTTFPDLENNPREFISLIRSYNLLNAEINFMCNFMKTHLDLSDDLALDIRRHSQRIQTFKYSRKKCFFKDCQWDHCFPVQYLGPYYNKHDLKIEPKSFPPQTFLFCVSHFYVADTFFLLNHMKWNIYKNIEHRINEKNINCLGNKLILEDIGDAVITNLAAYYFSIISRLKSTDPEILRLRERKFNATVFSHFTQSIAVIEAKTRLEIK